MTQNKPLRILREIESQPWAITGDGLRTIFRVAEREGDIDAVLARRGEQPEGVPRAQIRENGVAVLQIHGPIFRYADMFTEISGATSVSQTAKDLQGLAEDPDVRSIILDIDSPGGQANGINELYKHILAVEKPVIAYVGGMAASAAYWLASAADRIVADETALLGSIGVVVSYRKQEDKDIEIVSTASPKKRPDPETDEGRAQILARADALAEVFIQAVAEGRRIAPEQVAALQGDVVIASAAIKAGLADEIGSLEQLIAQEAKFTFGGNTMNIEDFKANHADLYTQVKEEGRTEAQQELDNMLAQARTESRDNAREEMSTLIHAVLGEDAKTKMDQVVQAGLTPEQVEASKTIFSGPASGTENVSRQQILDGLNQAAADAVSPVQEIEKQPQDFEAAVKAYRDKHECTKGQAIRAVADEYPELHKKYIRENNS